MTFNEGKNKENSVLKDSCTNKYNLNKRKEEQKKTKDITSQTIKLSALSSIHANHVTSNEIGYISITDDFITKFMNPYDQQLFHYPIYLVFKDYLRFQIYLFLEFMNPT
ncbi:hypothetical protein DLAC_05824 [Tieghemostelium lacteum]|uniref:Uncharacterized protein n=1 Tax=Tieghemostelium lacteum TaxID=361077 RepID=A0A151ZGZ3_TIELA|nr:hypothetical protein DLAC_05824 [Tieghemostelium lacteum]|eukprot:KYQ93187.1 hypothetical protein DLAC_05824 [Tieghemostelium lacteum]